MEGIEQNPVVYELMSEMAFRSEKVQVQVSKLCFLALLPLPFSMIKREVLKVVLGINSYKLDLQTFVLILFYDCSIPLILKEWLKTYSYRRYGKTIHQVEAAWEILHRTIYNCTDGIAVCFLRFL